MLYIEEISGEVVGRNQVILENMLLYGQKIVIVAGIMLLGLVIGILVQHFFIVLSKHTFVSRMMKRIGLNDLLKQGGFKENPLVIVGRSIKVAILIVFLRYAIGYLGFVEVEEFLQNVIAFLPNIIIALLIMLFAIRFSQTAGMLTENLMRFGNPEMQKIMGTMAKNILIAFGVLAALFQLKIAPELVQTLFTGFVAMLALAGGLAFGLGSKDFVAEMLEVAKKQKKQTGAKKK